MRGTGFDSILERIDSLLKGNPSLALERMNLFRSQRESITIPIGWTSQKSMESAPLLTFLI